MGNTTWQPWKTESRFVARTRSHGFRRHGRQQRILVAAGIVDEHVNAAVAGENFLQRLLPGFRRRNVQYEARTSSGIFLRQLVGVFAPGMDSEKNEIGGRLLEKGAGDGLSQPAIGTGDENDS